MPYREEFFKKLQQLRDYKVFWETDQENALKIKNIIPAKEASFQLGRFMNKLSHTNELFGGIDQRKAFFTKHRDLFPEGRFPTISTSPEHCKVNITEADYEKIFDALQEEFKGREDVLDNIFFNECAPNYRENRHPMTDLVNEVKKDVDKLYEDENTKVELKNALDFANEELVEKTGENLYDNIIDANSAKRTMKARRDFDDFVKKNGLDPNKVQNKSKLLTVINPGFDNHHENYEVFKPILDMGVSYDQDYKDKILQLDALCKQEGLLTKAVGGESGSKEYGLADYFQKNYALKTALTNYRKLTDDEEKKQALARIKALTEDVKTVTAKYEKVFDFIEKNFDLENISLSGNIYSGRKSEVPDGDLEKWRPNLPPIFDFEKSPAVIFLSGFTQLKAACQAEEATLEEFLDQPAKVFLAGAKKFGDAEDKKIYLPPSEENTLGKRMAHMFYHSSRSYDELPAITMMGGRGMEFLYNTSPSNDKTIDNVIKSLVIKDYAKLYNHSPGLFFGNSSSPNIDKIKNIFVAGDEVDSLLKVSPDYVNDDCKLDCAVKNYSLAVKAHGNTPIDQEYRRIVKAMKECFEEQEEMSNHPEIYLKSPKDNMFLFSHGAILASGRQFFADYLRENNLSLDSIQDEDLRNEITDFMLDPVQTFNDKHFRFPGENENPVETFAQVKKGFKDAWNKYGKKNTETFMEKFNENNHKPHGYNANKDIPTILHDNRGGWWERFRGTTSKQYQALVRATEASLDPQSPINGDKEAMYLAAKSYRAYKLPEGRDFNSLSKTAKKRVEFCDSIIAAYEQEKAAREAVNNPAPIQQVNNNIIDQNKFQHQLENDIEPNEAKESKAEKIEEKAIQKEAPEDGVSV